MIARNVVLAGPLCLGLTSLAAHAQEVPEIRILPPEASQPAPDPGQEPATVPDPVPAQRDRTPDTAETPQRRLLMTLRPASTLPRGVVMGASLAEPGIVRLTGEVAEAEFEVSLPAGAAGPQEIVLNLRSAIDVLPDTAVLQVSVNGAAPVDFPLTSFQGFAPLRVPAPGLVAGTNRIGIMLRQPHRIFCGPDASFRVWTEIDLASSGAEYANDAIRPDAALFSLAAGNQISAGRPLALLADQDTDPGILRELATTLGAAMQGQGQVEISSFYAPRPVGAASVALIPSDENRVTYRKDAAGAMVLQIESTGTELPDLSGAFLPEALPAPRPPALVVPGRNHSLADLGSGDIIGNTHYFRRDLPFRLPSDWLLLANQKAQLRLHYGFASGLPEGAMLLVKVNDQTVRLLPLDRDGGRLLEPLAVPFAARLLHPGLNKLSFEMMVPGNPADAACPARRADMLVVTSDTAISVPSSPAMTLTGLSSQLAGLASSAIGVNPAATDQRRMALLAAQLTAGLTPAETEANGVRLVLTDIAGLAQSGSAVPQRMLQEALLPAATAAVSTQPSVAATPRFRLNEDEETIPAPVTEPPAGQTPGSIRQWFARQEERVRDAAFMTSDDELDAWLQGRRGDALLMPGSPEEPDTLQLVLGPAADINAVGAALNSLKDAWLGEGKAVLISNDGTWQVWSSARLPRMEGAVTPLNLLPVLGNYASWSPFMFTAGLLVLALASIIPALLIVVLFRNRRMR